MTKPPAGRLKPKKNNNCILKRAYCFLSYIWQKHTWCHVASILVLQMDGWGDDEQQEVKIECILACRRLKG